MSALHLLQQNLNEALLFRTVTRKLVTLASELVEFTVRLEAQHLGGWVAPVIHKIEEIDEDRLQDLLSVSKAP